jgi:hypothetical protein
VSLLPGLTRTDPGSPLACSEGAEMAMTRAGAWCGRLRRLCRGQLGGEWSRFERWRPVMNKNVGAS